jgi:acyl-CoA synthetase (AMP-forming)/AMP-acid ligase II
MNTLVAALRRHAAEGPDRLAVVHLADGDALEQPIRYGELDRRARAFAAHLQGLAERGERAVLLYPSGIEFVVAYLGCLYAGVIAVCVPLPHLKHAFLRLERVLEDAQATVACTTREAMKRIAPALKTPLRWVASEDVAPGVESEWRAPELSPDDLAFLQYTSGSTTTPRGVMISHRNLVATSHDLQRVSAFDADSIVVTWLPMFHDLGLLAGLLAPLEAGGRCYTLDPVHFQARPVRWWSAISRYRATHTAAPDSAFLLCTQKITAEERRALDLRSFRSATVGSEPVHVETMTAFAAAFAECGFSSDAFLPGYGLAEATVMVSGKKGISFCTVDRKGLEQNRVILRPDGEPSVSCGWSTIGADIQIVHPETATACAADEIGEVWVHSDSVAKGYWRRPEETERTFGARLADGGDAVFLRTGDMGFIHEGGLHIAGRIKDMIIVQGKNFYPQDIEIAVEQCHAAVRHGGGAAFVVEQADMPGLAIVQEVNWAHRKLEQPMEVVNRIRMAVAERNGLRARAVVLVRPASIPRTTSGKIQRRACKDGLLAGALDVLFEWKH